MRNVLTSPEPVSFSRRTLLFGVMWVKWQSGWTWTVPSYLAGNVSRVNCCDAMLCDLVDSTEGGSSRFVQNVSSATLRDFTSKLCSPVQDGRVTFVSEHTNCWHLYAELWPVCNGVESCCCVYLFVMVWSPVAVHTWMEDTSHVLKTSSLLILYVTLHFFKYCI